MSDLRDLYQEIILDHGRRPRNCHKMEDPCCQADGYNPLCGDKLTLYLRSENGVVQEASFEGSGCAISTASVSMLTEAVKGKTETEARQLIAKFVAMVTDSTDEKTSTDDLGKLSVFSGVKEFPSRVKCATLAWHTLEKAIDSENKDDKEGDPASSE